MKFKKFEAEEISRKQLKAINLKKNILDEKIKIDLKFIKKFLNIKNIKINPNLKKKLIKYNLKFRYLNKVSESNFNLNLIKISLSKKLTKSGLKKKTIWEQGWFENLKEFNPKNIKTIYPKYFRKQNYFYRLKGKVIYSKKKYFEILFSELIYSIVISHYLKKIKNIYEFGAGSGRIISSLMSNFNENLNYYASDWSTNANKILKKINIKNKKINNFSFNFFKPNKKKILNNSLVFTGGALEQTGKNYKKFVKYLLRNKPKIIINFEPMNDLYNQDNLNDFALRLYATKRNYLSNYIIFLKRIEKEKKIKIIHTRRLFGGPYHEGYSFIVWKILK